ncbi:MAG: methyltransferase domain-containing protein, partial [Chthoniobacterales bacterium]
DYGCGGSPYRSLFKDSTYHRADFPGIPDLDFEYGEDSILPVKDETYDFVLSTQVLEHVRIPSRYLNEARRVLRPKGKIILTTHGFFEEHGAPYDYHRWTAEGLCDALRRSGFEVDQILKLTTGARALLFLWRRFQHLVVTGKNSRATFPLSIAKRLLRLDPAGVDRFCDANFHSSRMVDGADNGHALYIAVMIVAHRP